MSTKSPAIKFSPFEALLIGEKNNVIKRQPMKNNIFITKVNRNRKTLTLRDLFDVETDHSKPVKGDGVFKVPQRVKEYMKNKKVKSSTDGKTQNLLYINFSRQKVVLKKNCALKSKSKNSKLGAKKIKFNNRCTFKAANYKAQVARKFHSYGIRTKYNSSKSRKILSGTGSKKFQHQNKEIKRHSLRDEKGRFISRKEYKKLESKSSSKDQYLSNYVCHLYMSESSKLLSDNAELEEKEEQEQVSTKLEHEAFQELDVDCTETALDKLLVEYYTQDFLDNCILPNYPAQLEASDFDDDKQLIGYVYENFPNVIFESQDVLQDFDDSLKLTGIVPQEKCLKMYEKKKSGVISAEKLTVLFNNHIPYLRLRQLQNSQSHHYSYKNGRNGFYSVIDEPCTKKNHLITTKNFECMFLRGFESKEVFLNNFMKPLWVNSWFGRLPES
ncbi:hypothetical protein RUM43_013175 [Polyplax serrata]|uniref:Uncharacterized protein n=1 Tax=Polyplax serrata TaxID=468196 RepID=A0AAN8S791_POLSC